MPDPEFVEVPEADALEQRLGAAPGKEEDESELPTVGPEVPEADALEQSLAVPVDEDGYEGG